MGNVDRMQRIPNATITPWLAMWLAMRRTIGAPPDQRTAGHDHARTNPVAATICKVRTSGRLFRTSGGLPCFTCLMSARIRGGISPDIEVPPRCPPRWLRPDPPRFRRVRLLANRVPDALAATPRTDAFCHATATLSPHKRPCTMRQSSAAALHRRDGHPSGLARSSQTCRQPLYWMSPVAGG